MGKGYNNYMCKKPFHPGSKANIKRAWMAEQKTENEKRKQEELKAQYEKEQNLYNNRALISSESKDKLELNFMYEAPPGAKRERQKEDDEPEFKFEWQRKYNAPREDYAKGNEDIKDQPFGIPVRNVRCIKCHKWGHINTDKECPLYNQASTSSMPTTSMDPMELMRQMKEDGFGLKENVLGHQLNPAAANQQFIPSEDESDPEIDFLKSLSSADKKKLLKKLKKLSRKQEKSSNCKKKKKSKKSKKSKSKGKESSSDSEKSKKSKKKKSKKSSSSDSDSSSDESVEKRQTKKSKHLEHKERITKPESDSIEDTTRKEKRNKSRQESSDYVKHKTIETKMQPQEKDSRESYQEDFNPRVSKKDISHEKVRNLPKKESPDIKKHKTKEIKQEKNFVEKKIKYSSSNSDEERSETFCDGVISRNEKDSSPSCSYKVKRESTEDSSDHSKYKSKEIKNELEEKVKHIDGNPDQEKYRSLKTEVIRVFNDFFAPKRNHETSSPQDTKKIKYDHPDGFSHLCPQAHIKSNYLQSSEEYEGKVHDEFRQHYRVKRSPSVKQKYNN